MGLFSGKFKLIVPDLTRHNKGDFTTNFIASLQRGAGIVVRSPDIGEQIVWPEDELYRLRQ